MYLVASVRPFVCLSGFTQGTLYTTKTVYGVLVHQEGAICTTKAQYAPWCTRETIFFEKYVAWVRMSALNTESTILIIWLNQTLSHAGNSCKSKGGLHVNVKLHFFFSKLSTSFLQLVLDWAVAINVSTLHWGQTFFVNWPRASLNRVT